MKNNKDRPEILTQSPGTHRLIKWILLLVLVTCVYFGNTYVQSYLGRQALQATGLTINTLEEALVEAKRNNKLVLADMSAIWCPTCRKLDKVVLSDEAVQTAITQGFVFARIEYESEQGEAFMHKYQVMGFPTLLVLDSDGKKLAHLPLTFEPQTFVTMLTQIMEDQL